MTKINLHSSSFGKIVQKVESMFLSCGIRIISLCRYKLQEINLYGWFIIWWLYRERTLEEECVWERAPRSRCLEALIFGRRFIRRYLWLARRRRVGVWEWDPESAAVAGESCVVEDPAGRRGESWQVCLPASLHSIASHPTETISLPLDLDSHFPSDWSASFSTKISFLNIHHLLATLQSFFLRREIMNLLSERFSSGCYIK